MMNQQQKLTIFFPKKYHGFVKTTLWYDEIVDLTFYKEQSNKNDVNSKIIEKDESVYSEQERNYDCGYYTEEEFYPNGEDSNNNTDEDN